MGATTVHEAQTRNRNDANNFSSYSYMEIIVFHSVAHLDHFVLTYKRKGERHCLWRIAIRGARYCYSERDLFTVVENDLL